MKPPDELDVLRAVAHESFDLSGVLADFAWSLADLERLPSGDPGAAVLLAKASAAACRIRELGRGADIIEAYLRPRERRLAAEAKRHGLRVPVAR